MLRSRRRYTDEYTQKKDKMAPRPWSARQKELMKKTSLKYVNDGSPRRGIRRVSSAPLPGYPKAECRSRLRLEKSGGYF